jgi:hypothetical protein
MSNLPDTAAGTGGPAGNTAPAPAPRPDHRRPSTRMDGIVTAVRLGSALACLVLLIYVVLNPNTHYGRIQAAVIFLLGGLTTGVLVGSEIANRFHMQGKRFVITLVGSSAVTFLTAFALQRLAQSEEQIVAFYIEDEMKRPVLLSAKDSASVRPAIGASELTYYTSNDTILVILTQDHAQLEVFVRPNPIDPSIVHRATLDRPPHARSRLRLGKDGTLSVIPFGG